MDEESKAYKDQLRLHIDESNAQVVRGSDEWSPTQDVQVQTQTIARPGFTDENNLIWSVCYETTSDVQAAIDREEQIKVWTRSKKAALVESANPNWVNLSAEWFNALDSSLRSE